MLNVLGVVSPVLQVLPPEKIAKAEIGLPGHGNHHVIAGGSSDPLESQIGLVQVLEHLDAQRQFGNRAFRVTVQDVALVELEPGFDARAMRMASPLASIPT